MKNFAALLPTLALAASTVLAQSITIGFPHDGDEFTRGETIKLRVETDPNYDVQALRVTIVIEDCGNGYQNWNPPQNGDGYQNWNPPQNDDGYQNWNPPQQDDGYQNWNPQEHQRRADFRDWEPEHNPERVCYADGEHGTVLYRGDFNPSYTDGRPELGYHQTFDVSIPWDSEFEEGSTAAITVVHEYVVGNENQYKFDYTSVNVRVN